jgi:thioredoxin-related protein
MALLSVSHLDYRVRLRLALLSLCALPIVLAMLLVPRLGAALPAPDDDYFIPSADLAATLEQARQSGKAGVVVLYEMDGCGECARLRADTLNAPPLRDYFRQHFVTVSLHADTDLPVRRFAGTPTTAAGLADSERVVALPTVVLYDLDGAPVAREVGRTGTQGHWLRLGRYLVERGYEEAPFAAWQPTD